MAPKSVTRADLAEAVYQQAPVTKEFASDLVGQVLEAMCSALEAGDPVKLSSFGVSAVRTKGSRIGRNPKTNVEVPIAPSRALSFSASPVLKAHVNRASSRSSNSLEEGRRRRKDERCEAEC
ncbi:integration host factor subunit alpha [Microvirga sp. VF16]|uniref:integration host factor subunit alpha n=1 Tax=Microvirga sp. VF16 TaxID=2807101 RepID=UPI00193CE323|nr:integration host factor subunit alpha [Microvirga sp. VF16]QRM32971.1 integration host factor subunit alpha [Microvirga sp. VF16]